MRAVTCAFYAVASFALGAIAFVLLSEMSTSRTEIAYATQAAFALMIGGPIGFVIAGLLLSGHRGDTRP